MFDRHQAEITVMQFRGHSLPVHQSMSVSWAFTLSHFVSQIHLRDLFRLLAIGMCHFLPVLHFGMACLAGSKVKIQQYFRLLSIFVYITVKVTKSTFEFRPTVIISTDLNKQIYFASSI